MKKFLIAAVVVSCWTSTNYAQCAMCKASAETNAQNGGKAAATCFAARSAPNLYATPASMAHGRGSVH